MLRVAGLHSTNAAADALISDAYKDFLTLPEGFSGDMEMIQNISADAQAAHELVWTEFKTAAGQ